MKNEYLITKEESCLSVQFWDSVEWRTQSIYRTKEVIENEEILIEKFKEKIQLEIFSEEEQVLKKLKKELERFKYENNNYLRLYSIDRNLPKHWLVPHNYIQHPHIHRQCKYIPQNTKLFIMVKLYNRLVNLYKNNNTDNFESIVSEMIKVISDE